MYMSRRILEKKVVGALTRMGFIAIVTLYECWIGWPQETI